MKAIMGLGAAAVAAALAIGAVQPRHGATHAPKGNITIVAIDDASLAAVGPWPWSRATHARLVDALVRAGASRIAFDVSFEDPSRDPDDDRALAAALRRAPTRPILAVAPDGHGRGILPNATLADAADLGSVGASTGRDMVAQSVGPLETERGSIGSMAAALSRKPASADLPVDWTLDRARIPVVSAKDLLAGRIPDLAGRTAVVAPVAPRLGDQHRTPDGGMVAGSYIIAIAAEGARR